ncbi:MAG: hypothetical protein QXI87_08030 [Thermoproteota archaeon]
MKWVNELKLDYEQKNPQKRLSIKRVGFIARKLRLTVKDVKAWRTANGIHVRITTKEKMHPITAVLIQALMGSDYAREVYNAIRTYNLNRGGYSETAEEVWNVLFYKKLVKREVASQEKNDDKLTKKLMKELIKP